ncbi:hypothetical protein GCM10009540_77210 [Streptomyces turgidiscabies]
MFTDTGVLRVVAAFAAAITVVGAAVMRRWDGEAGKQVADLTRARAGDDWRHEERVAELETDLEESRELRVKLEQKLRAKRAELQGLRNEHAALLRRYATAETERASALEGRRLLELEAAVSDQDVDGDTDIDTGVDTDVEVKAAAAKGSARALAAGSGSGDSADVLDGDDAVDSDAAALDAAAAGVSAALGAVGAHSPDDSDDAESSASGEGPAAPAIFSPEGSSLFLRARAALARFDGEAPVKTEPALAAAKASAQTSAKTSAEVSGPAVVSDGPAVAEAEAVREDEAKGKPEAARGHSRAASTPAETKPAKPLLGAGHFTVPTAVAVVPTSAPVRRPTAEGGFDFFGTQKETASAALEAVQNEDLADVVGQEALALHKAESEGRFKPADETSRGVGIGQVIDLTAHDETEQIDLQGLRSAVS